MFFFRISLIGPVASHDDPGAVNQSSVDRDIFFNLLLIFIIKTTSTDYLADDQKSSKF